MERLSRRKFLKISGATAAGLLVNVAGCVPSPASQPAQPVEKNTQISAIQIETPSPAPSNTAKVKRTPVPSDTPTGPQKTYRRPEIIQYYPAVKSRVVRARSADAWQGDKLSPNALRKLVDSAIIKMTEKEDAKTAWLALFDPGEKIAIKVNAFRNSTIWTHPELVRAVTDSMQGAGIPGDHITIFDYTSQELKTAGFEVNEENPGVLCYGSQGHYSFRWQIAPYNSAKLSDILVNADALINMPVLKSHMIAGITFALKNHYGSVMFPDALHNIDESLSGLNSLPPIKNATRLVIGDVLEANTKYANSWPYWEADYRGDSILMSYDPLAHDTVGYDMLLKLAEEKGNPTKHIKGMAESWFKVCGDAGLGANDLNNIELLEI